MSVVAMESQCMKTIMIHLVDKSDFILSDYKTTLQIFPVIRKSEGCDFSCTKFILLKISVSRKLKPSQEISTILC